jgi:hypothetical protein
VQADTPQVEVQIPDEAVRADTLPQEGRPEPADPLRPAPSFPVFPAPRTAGFAAGTWVFGPAELGRFHGLTLLELLERIPGLLVTREGDVGRPAGVAAFGSGGGRFRVFLDGWELRALNGASPELQHVPLVDVVEVRVTRGLAETRIDLETIRMDDARPFAQIEGGEGDFGIRMLRGYFARPVGERVMVHVGMDLVETAGFRRLSDFSENTVMARASWLPGPDRGIQLDFRNTAIDTERRVAGVALPRESFDRGELLLRGRGRVRGDFWVDAALGRSRVTPEGNDTVTLARASVQGMLRGTLQLAAGSVSGTARLHRVDAQGYAGDAAELSARAELAPAPGLAAWGEARALSTHGVGGAELEAGGRAGPWGGLSLFGSVAVGSRGLPFRTDTLLLLPTFPGTVDPALSDSVEVPVLLFRARESAVRGFRAGAEARRGSAVAGAAFVAQDLTEWVPFGFLFDRHAPPVPGGTVGGVEGYLDVPVIWRQLRLHAHYVDFLATPARPYLPARFGRGALEYHWIYRDGNLEPTIRAEVIARDRALTVNPETGAFDVETEPYALFNLFVQVRVLDVRAFWRMENVVNRTTAFDVPGRFLPGNRSMFGVRWFFRD